MTGCRRVVGVPKAARRRSVRAVLAGAAALLLTSCSSGPEPYAYLADVGAPSLVVGAEELSALPTGGAAWKQMRQVADGDLGRPDLSDQDSTTAGRTLAAALVFARTGDERYRAEVITRLRAVPGTLDGSRVLSVGRQLAGYVIAADLVGFRDDGFVDFMAEVRTLRLGGHGRWYALTQTSEDSASNWGAWALTSRIAISAYIGDTADVDRAALVFRGFLGDRGAYAQFEPTGEFNPSWVCGDVDRWVPINPGGCRGRSGAIVEEVSRAAGDYPAVDDVSRGYLWESLGAAALSAELLSRQGYPDVFEWSDQALLRAAEFAQGNGGYPPPYSVNQYIPWSINKAYGVDLGPVAAAGFGRQFGYTDWLP